MDNKIIILGNGFIARRLQQDLKCGLSDRKIFTYQDAQELIERFNPEIIINCIGHIGKNVDDCEKDLDKTLMANSFIPLILAEVSLRNNIRFIHISTGCIYHYDYSKDTPIDEEKIPDFFGLFYSRTKIYSDRALVALSNKFPFLIIRIRVPLDNRPHPKNLLTKLINFKKVIDLPNSVTYMPDFVSALEYLIKIDAKGIYNVVNKNPLRYSELMEVYKKYVPEFNYELIEFKKLNSVRTNLILSIAKLEKTGFKVREIKDILEECVKTYLRY